MVASRGRSGQASTRAQDGTRTSSCREKMGQPSERTSSSLSKEAREESPGMWRDGLNEEDVFRNGTRTATRCEERTTSVLKPRSSSEEVKEDQNRCK